MSIYTKILSTDSELDHVLFLYQTCFGTAAVPTEIQRAWWHKFPKGIIGLFENEILIGALSYWTLNEIGFNSMLNGELKEREISPEYIDADNAIGIYISEIAIQATHRGKKFATLLIQHFHILTQSQPKLPILALAFSEEGKQVLQREGFALLLTASQTPDQMDLYILK